MKSSASSRHPTFASRRAACARIRTALTIAARVALSLKVVGAGRGADSFVRTVTPLEGGSWGEVGIVPSISFWPFYVHQLGVGASKRGSRTCARDYRYVVVTLKNFAVALHIRHLGPESSGRPNKPGGHIWFASQRRSGATSDSRSWCRDAFCGVCVQRGPEVYKALRRSVNKLPVGPLRGTGGRVPARIRRNPRIAAQRHPAQGGSCGDPGVRPRLRRRPTSPKVVTGRVVRATLAAPYRPRPGARRAGRHGGPDGMQADGTKRPVPRPTQ